MRASTRKLTGLTAGLVLIVPLASCTATAPADAGQENTPSTTPRAVAQATVPSTAATGEVLPGRTHVCTTDARYDAYKVDGGEWQWSMTGSRMDAGPGDHATCTANDDLTEYVVAPGDTFTGIGERFCIDYVQLAMINRRDSFELSTGETIRLFPDGPAADYFSDPDA
ncbi:hypothetical protein [Microbacterium sp.]|uniref:hypothetical protein n=1 Tax=Microbacterium sp. TaxID=51671 RepID=UPI0039E33994